MLRGGPKQPLPARFRTQLTYQSTVGMNNAGTGYAGKRYNATYAYDMDPVVGSISLPYFTELGGIYRFYRVNASRVIVSFANLETFPLTCYIVPVNYDPGANAVPFQYTSNPLARVRMIGGLNGMNSCRLSNAASTEQFAGSHNAHLADYYSGTTAGTAPSNNWFWAVGVDSAGVALVSGVALSVQIFVDIEFYELGTPAV